MTVQPNILLLLTDQQRFDTITALGSAFGARTPHLDEFIREGITFTNCHCTAPVSSPSRSTLMTGLHPCQAGMPANLYNPCPPLPREQPTLATRLAQAGYETAYHGKWHLGGHVRDYGFQYGEECSHDESTRLAASRYWRDRDWIERDKPFFHVVSFLDPHDIYSFDPEGDPGPEGFRRPWPSTGLPEASYPPDIRSRRKAWPETHWGRYHHFYAERVEKVDRDIGLLLDELRCSGFFQNTWILFASDHGDMAGEHDLPFKGSFMYEGVTKVPLVLVPPRTRFLGDFTRILPPVVDITRGIRCGALCSLLDVPPTIMDLAGLAADPGLRGQSLLPWARGHAAGEVHDTVFAAWHSPPVRMARSAEWKLVLHGDGSEALFHLASDPHEICNRAHDPAVAEVRQELRDQLIGHLDAIGDSWRPASPPTSPTGPARGPFRHPHSA